MPTYSFHFLSFHVSPAHFLIKKVAYQSSMLVQSQFNSTGWVAMIFELCVTVQGKNVNEFERFGPIPSVESGQPATYFPTNILHLIEYRLYIGNQLN
ncbi:hypothetical protein YC2023_106715 [Brassica napus]